MASVFICLDQKLQKESYFKHSGGWWCLRTLINNNIGYIMTKRKTMKKAPEKDSYFLGVCSGIANHYNIDPTIVRAGFVVSLVFAVGMSALVYMVLAFVMPDEEDEPDDK